MDRVLIVDDDTVVRETLLLALEDEPFELTAAVSAEEGLAVWQPGQWATLIVDKNLPGMSGVDFIREVRRQDESVGILMITGYGSVETALDTLHLGIDGYLEKPFEDIFAVVRDVGETVKAADRRGSALGHFAKATQHLAAIHSDRPFRVLLGVDAQSADWIRERIDNAQCEVAAGRAEIMERARDRWDLMFLEVDMHQDPVAWLKEVRAAAPQVPCVVLSVRPKFDIITQLIRLRVGAVLEHPLNERQFESRVGPVLSRVRGRVGGPS